MDECLRIGSRIDLEHIKPDLFLGSQFRKEETTVTKSIICTTSSRTLLQRFSGVLTGMMALGAIASSLLAGTAYGADGSNTSQQFANVKVSSPAKAGVLASSATPDTGTTTETVAAQSPADPSLSDGVYLYGQSAEPDQIGSAYMVFEVNEDQVVGAFYMPYSSFDCFYGSQQPDQLALTVVDSYERTAHPYAIAFENNSSVASAGSSVLESVGLEGYQEIETVSENDQRLLQTCKTNSPAQL